MPLQDPGHQESRHQEAGGSAVGKAFVEGQHFLQHVARVGHLRIVLAVEGSHGARLKRDVAAQHIVRTLMGDGKALPCAFPGIQQAVQM